MLSFSAQEAIAYTALFLGVTIFCFGLAWLLMLTNKLRSAEQNIEDLQKEIQKIWEDLT